MNDGQSISDERLNAFVDNQLGSQECDEILTAIATDAELGQRLCELRSAKELVRHAYGRVPNSRRPANRHFSIWSGAIAASLTLMIGVLVGWLGHQAATLRETPGPTASWAERVFSLAPTRILIHLDNSRSEQMDAALDLAEAYLAKSKGAHVEIITNHSGLDLLRAETTPYAERIAGIRKHYEQVGFIACGQTIMRLKSGGLDTELVPEAAVTGTAIEHVASRVQQGWTYLKI